MFGGDLDVLLCLAYLSDRVTSAASPSLDAHMIFCLDTSCRPAVGTYVPLDQSNPVPECTYRTELDSSTEFRPRHDVSRDNLPIVYDTLSANLLALPSGWSALAAVGGRHMIIATLCSGHRPDTSDLGPHDIT
nr:hypothetical protein CFP56_71703 [Quercus suber]